MHIKNLNWGLLVPAVVLGFSAPVQAEEGFLEEVIVTAQRIEQSLQDVPLAVSAFSADALAEQQIETMSDLQLATPSLQFAAADGRGGSFAIRGITNLATSATIEVTRYAWVEGSTQYGIMHATLDMLRKRSCLTGS